MSWFGHVVRLSQTARERAVLSFGCERCGHSGFAFCRMSRLVLRFIFIREINTELICEYTNHQHTRIGNQPPPRPPHPSPSAHPPCRRDALAPRRLRSVKHSTAPGTRAEMLLGPRPSAQRASCAFREKLVCTRSRTSPDLLPIYLSCSRAPHSTTPYFPLLPRRETSRIVSPPQTVPLSAIRGR